MDAVLDKSKDFELKASQASADRRPSQAEAEAAVTTLILWAGDDPAREGLRDTPTRVTKAYGEYFAGYAQNPITMLSRTFEKIEGYDDMVVLRDMRFESHCEHHMVPIIGKAHIGYMPNGRVVGISKLARVLDIFAQRLQTQETMTAQIANALEEALAPLGVAVVLDAEHQCMTMRGVKKNNTNTITRQFRGCFKEERFERQFWDIVQNR